MLGTANLSDILENTGEFINENNYLWQVSGRQTFSSAGFYLPVSSIDPFGNVTLIEYDHHNLLIDRITDPLLDAILVDNDYYTLLPREITDTNLNHTEVAFDALGMVTALAVKGKYDEHSGEWEGDTITDPTVVMVYEMNNWKDNRQPVYVRTSARETHKE